MQSCAARMDCEFLVVKSLLLVHWGGGQCARFLQQELQPKISFWHPWNHSMHVKEPRYNHKFISDITYLV